jgi:hypothetical protein
MATSIGKVAIAAACGSVAIAVLADGSIAAEPRRGLPGGDRARIEQDIRRGYNARPHINSQRPAQRGSDLQYRSGAEHLNRGVLIGPGATVAPNCTYQYRRWKKTRNSYWRDRYYECAG